jgi:hypothetical protein
VARDEALATDAASTTEVLRGGMNLSRAFEVETFE